MLSGNPNLVRLTRLASNQQKPISRGCGSAMLSSSLAIPSSVDVFFVFFYLGSTLWMLSSSRLRLGQLPAALPQRRQDPGDRGGARGPGQGEPAGFHPPLPPQEPQSQQPQLPPQPLHAVLHTPPRPAAWRSACTYIVLIFLHHLFVLTNKYTNADFCVLLRKAHWFCNLICLYLPLDQILAANNNNNRSEAQRLHLLQAVASS